MLILKCKMCGGNIAVTEGSTYGTCDSCQSVSTLPNITEQIKANIFNKANHFRQNGEFDLAISTYEQILEKDGHDPEAHWCLALSKYGIEYVTDPFTNKKIPTCHRVQMTSFRKDFDYLAALEYTSDPYTRELYINEATKIYEIQKEILHISNKEKPYDIFICYKDSDEYGNRTLDSVLAEELYHALTKEGYHVFFSRITLESILGKQYEPYIFSALHSSKVMLVVGTKTEYFDAVWVKNEWSRFIKINKENKQKALIPCYKNIDILDIPLELSAYQSLDLSKIGYWQDLLHGIKKIISHIDEVGSPLPKEEENLVSNGMGFLLKQDYVNASNCFNHALHIDPKNGLAYLGRLCIDYHVPNRYELVHATIPMESNGNFINAMSFCDDSIKTFLKELLPKIKENCRQKAIEDQYCYANKLCMDSADKNSLSALKNYQSAYKIFTSLNPYKDSLTLAHECEKQIKHIKRVKISHIATIATTAGFVLSIIIGAQLYDTHIGKPKEIENTYNLGMSYYRDGNYDAARSNFSGIEEYKDSEIMIKECYYLEGEDYFQEGGFEGYKNAGVMFKIAGDYKDSIDRISECYLEMALIKAREGDFNWGGELLANCTEDHRTIYRSTIYDYALEFYESGNYHATRTALNYTNNYGDSAHYLRLMNEQPFSIGNYHSHYVKTDGSVNSFGLNQHGQCDTLLFTDIIALAAGDDHIVALRKDGTVVANGARYDSRCNVSGIQDAIQVAAGMAHTSILLADGTIKTLGGYAPNTVEYRNVMQIDAGGDMTVGIYYSGWPFTTDAKLNELMDESLHDWQSLTQIATGGNHIVGLKEDGSVVAIGDNYYGQLDISSFQKVIAIDAGPTHTVALKSDGTVIATGNNEYGNCDVNHWENIIAIQAGPTATFGLKNDGTMVVAGETSYNIIFGNEQYQGQFSPEGWTDLNIPMLSKN